MPYLIDGNNLHHALRKAGLDLGRGPMCELIARLLPEKERVAVVFDGPPPPGGIPALRVEITFAVPKSADDIILEQIAANTAPRRLTVVSTDRALRRAARRRRCSSLTSEEFLAELQRLSDRPAPRPPSEPPEKRTGLTPEQTQAWLKEFRMDEE